MLNSHVFQLQGRVTSVIKSGTTNTTVRWPFKEKPGNRLSQVEITEEGKGLDYAVYGSNPDYVFILKRKSPDSPWVLRDFKKKPTDQDFRLPEEYRMRGGLGKRATGHPDYRFGVASCRLGARAELSSCTRRRR